jgi:hypothetical protein
MPFCANCGVERGSTTFCSNCGAPAASGNAPAPPDWSRPPAPQGSTGTNGLAIASFICSLLCVSLVGVIPGHVALSQMKKSPQDGRGLAIAGLVLGYIGLAAGLVWLLLVVGIFAAAGSSY